MPAIPWFIWVAAIVSALATATFCNSIAAEKGYASGSASFIGFFFGPLALIYYAGLPDLYVKHCLDRLTIHFVPSQQEEESESDDEDDETNDT